mmetsp:Transcript_3382/g.7751  ORF Transcript_3382/g.7751 Transcript_3382/m.7751 type:complete len:497 (-) Transcript_3382:328-1818(-)
MLERRSSIRSIEHKSGRLYEVETNTLSSYPLSLYVLASMFMLFFLFVITEPRHTFVFTAGENLRIPVRYSILTQDNYEIKIPEGKEGAVDAFSLETCPTFSGQIINLNYEQDLLLNGQDYQYDYFILHPGSIVYSKITVSKGAAYFYLLQGDVFQLESLRHGKSFDVNSFRAVNMVYVSDSTEEGVVVTHTVKNEFAGRGQVWVLYYENPMSSGTTLHTRYAMKATSYNLNSFRPTCSTGSSSSSSEGGSSHCMVEANPCTIVQASNYYYDDDDDANQDDGREENGDDDYYQQQQQDDAYANADDQYGGNYRGDERYYYNRAKIREVEVQVTLNRNWTVIGGLTSLPTVFGLFLWISFRRKKAMGDVQKSVTQAEQTTDPSLSGYENWENGVKPAAALPSSQPNHPPPSPSKRDFIKSLYVPSSQWHSPTKSSISTIPPCNPPPPPPSTEMSNLGSRPLTGAAAGATTIESSSIQQGGDMTPKRNNGGKDDSTYDA